MIDTGEASGSLLGLSGAATADMTQDDFAALLAGYMRRIRASAGGVATEIGMSREAVNNWRQGLALPNRKHRHKLLACANHLRLTEEETDRLLRAAGFDVEFPATPEAAQGPYAGVIDGLYERLARLSPYPILLLLSQAHWGQPPFRERLLERARATYGATQVLHIRPPYSAAADAAEYFGAIGAQCGLEGVNSDLAFETALEKRLLAGPRLFVMVSRFEQGEPRQRVTLAGILRGLSETHGARLHLMLCGGEALAELKYQGGDLSLLNIARSEQWPEPTRDDVRELTRDAAVPALADPALERLSRHSGGHPALIEDGARLLRAQPDIDDEALVAGLARSERLWEAFLPLAANAALRESLAMRLAAPSLGRARPFLVDPLLRAAYWSNLVTSRREGDEDRLVWRCDAVVRAGLQVLSAGDPA
jgi:hypothetical protein